MNHDIIVQPTPNPNAFKFITHIDVISEGKHTFNSIEECSNELLVPMVRALFMLGSITNIHLFENVITVTKTDDHPWAIMEEAIKATVLQHIESHNPNFITTVSEKPVQKKQKSPELQAIDAILDKSIRPSLQMDGGDLTLISLKDGVLKLNYEGACGSCPSAQMGTLQAIQNIIHSEYDENIIVETI
ncbi:hypothetical protein AB834_07045 [PVC group bacterium (ex Bugula neritina AB1)]|nr:hypothetical protein AB834_07045 [PVC group bacterium (ex Bugula neritina AB1)]